MNVRTVLWSRLTLGVLSVIFLLLYTAQYKKYRSNYAYLSDKCSKLMVHSSGLSAQLQCKSNFLCLRISSERQV